MRSSTSFSVFVSQLLQCGRDGGRSVGCQRQGRALWLAVKVSRTGANIDWSRKSWEAKYGPLIVFPTHCNGDKDSDGIALFLHLSVKGTTDCIYYIIRPIRFFIFAWKLLRHKQIYTWREPRDRPSGPLPRYATGQRSRLMTSLRRRHAETFVIKPTSSIVSFYLRRCLEGMAQRAFGDRFLPEYQGQVSKIS